MKTVEEFIRELEGSEELRKELEAVGNKDSLEAFLKKNGCGFTAEEFVNAVGSEGELSDADAEAAAGGLYSKEKREIEEKMRECKRLIWKGKPI